MTTTTTHADDDRDNVIVAELDKKGNCSSDVVAKEQQQQMTEHDDDTDEESVVIKIHIPGSEHYNTSSSKRNRNNRSTQLKSDTARRLDRLYCYGIIVMIVLLIVAITTTTVLLVSNNNNNPSAVTDEELNTNHTLDRNSTTTPSFITKVKWPELLNSDAEIAKAIILSQRNDLTVYIVKQDAMVTEDYREDRVRLYVNQENVVIKTPTIG